MRENFPPNSVWVFVDPDGSPCLVQKNPPTDADFQHFGERAFRYELVLDEPPIKRDLDPR